MLEQLKKTNSNIKFFTTKGENFKKYGRVLNLDATSIIDHLSTQEEKDNIKNATKASYVTDREDLHDFECIPQIQKEIFGYLPIQAGVVKGKNQSLTGTEFHQGSEVNIAVTDCLLVLGNKYDMIDNAIDVSQMDVFYVEKGEVLEIYSTTLHYTPIEANKDGFSLVVILIEGTNTDIDFEKNSVLCKKNKWYVCHSSQTAKIEQGFKVGLIGDLLTIKYPK